MTIRYLLTCTLLAAAVAAAYSTQSAGNVGQVLLIVTFVALSIHVVTTGLRIRHVTMYLLMSILPIAIASRLVFSAIPDLQPLVESITVLPVVATLFWLTVIYWGLDLCMRPTLKSVMEQKGLASP